MRRSRQPQALERLVIRRLVRVTEYWRKARIERELAIYPDGKIVDLTDDE